MKLPAWFPFQKKAAPSASRIILWPSLYASRPASWMVQSMESYAAEGFEFNSLVYAAIMYKIRAQQNVRLVARKTDSHEELPPTDPLARLLARPNAFQSWPEFHGMNTVYLNLTGNVYIYLDRVTPNALPKRMLTLRPDYMYHIPGESETLAGFVYAPAGVPLDEGTPLLPEQVLHVRLPHPRDPLGGLGPGLSPLSACRTVVDVDNMVSLFLRDFFEHGAMPLGLLRYNLPLNREQIDEVRKVWRERYGGALNWLDVAVLGDGGEYQRVGMTFREMGFQSVDERTETRILGPLGVPAALIGARTGLARATYSNLQELRKAFWMDTFQPEMELYVPEFQHALGGDAVSVEFDYRRVAALQEDTPALVQAAYQLWSMGAPANLALQVVGVDIPEFAGGDTGWLPGGMVPLGRLPQAPATDEPKGVQRIAPPLAKAARPGADRHWRSLVEIAERWEPDYRQAAQREFLGIAETLRAILKGGRQKQRQEKASVDWQWLGAEMERALKAADDGWREAFLPLIRGTVQDVAELDKVQLGIRFDLRSALGEEWYQDYVLRFAQEPMATTERGVRLLLRAGLEHGWSIDTMEKALQGLFTSWATGEPGELPRIIGETPWEPDDREDPLWLLERSTSIRSEMIARTETIRACNAGTEALYQAVGVPEQEWLTAIDGRERDAHREANGQVVKVGEPFTVGGEKLMFPGDPNGSPENVIGCRCTILPVLPEGWGE